jgi:hypothetical protein
VFRQRPRNAPARNDFEHAHAGWILPLANIDHVGENFIDGPLAGPKEIVSVQSWRSVLT